MLDLSASLYLKAVGLASRHLAFKTKLFILCSIAEAIVSVKWFFWLSSFCFFVLKLIWCFFFFFSEFKITHEQGSFECVDTVFTHCLLACCFNHNWTNAWTLENSQKLFAVYLAKPPWWIKLYLELVSSYMQELDRYKKLKILWTLDWPN